MKEREKELLAIDWADPSIPTLPKVAHELLTIATNETIDADYVASLIEKDPSLAVRVLKTVNSAFYALNVEVTSIRHATVLLGFVEIARLATNSLILERFIGFPQDIRPHAEALWKHMFLTAMVADTFSEAGDENPDLYTLGLLHDLGWLILLSQAPKVFVSLATEASQSLSEAEALWQTDHCLWGAKLAELWGLPEPFQIVNLLHHNPFEEMKPPTYLLYICLSNIIVKQLGANPFNVTPPQPSAKLLQSLKLDRQSYDTMVLALKKDMGKMEGIFKSLCH